MPRFAGPSPYDILPVGLESGIDRLCHQGVNVRFGPLFSLLAITVDLEGENRIRGQPFPSEGQVHIFLQRPHVFVSHLDWGQ